VQFGASSNIVTFETCVTAHSNVTLFGYLNMLQVGRLWFTKIHVTQTYKISSGEKTTKIMM